MIKRWQGNSGQMQRLPEAGDRAGPQRRESYIQRPSPLKMPISPHERQSKGGSHEKKPGGVLSGLESLTKLLPVKAEELETEDIILLLILYLMYRESGDSELLMIMGAMFLL